MRLFIFVRHAESSANVAGVMSSDPAHSAGLTPRGRAQARELGAQLANLDIDLGVATRFLRSQQTLELALRGRLIPLLIDPGFDEIRAGEFDGAPIDAYRSWKERHAWSERLPNGDSVDDALLRYANALQRLLSRTETVTLVVVHEFALRQIAAAAATQSSRTPLPPFANAVPYLFGEGAIERAAASLVALARSDLAADR
jgi:broad specificity phosphatase PhoE